MRARWPAADVAAVSVLLVVAGSGLQSGLAGRWWLAAAAGLVVGVATGVAGARWRWPALVVIATSLIAYLALSGAVVLPETTVARVLPTPATATALLSGAVLAWKQVLTLPAPVEPSGAVLVVPFLLCQAAGVTGVSAALRSRRRWWVALVPVLLLLVATALLGAADPTAPLARAALLAAGAAAWVAWRRRRDPSSAAVPASGPRVNRRTHGGRSGRIGSALALLLVGVGATAAAAPLAGDGLDRFVLREHVVPPFDPKAYASPLAGFRQYVKAPDDELFTVTGLPAEARLRLATMDAFDGTVWDVAGSTPSPGSGRYEARVIPDAQSPAATRVEVEVLDYRGPWVPTTGQVASVTFGGVRETALTGGLHHNPAGLSVVDTAGLRGGDVYAFTTSWAAEAPLRGSPVAVAGVVLPAPEVVPDGVATTATQLAGGTTTPRDQAEALRSALATTGYFSASLGGAGSSRSGHGTDRLEAMLAADDLVGDDEQYASLMALMARELGLPARVVMGFRPPEDAGDGPWTVTGRDVAAWVEVLLEGAGWVTFDPTPPEDQVPPTRAESPRVEPIAQDQQPPPLPEPAPSPEATSSEPEDEREEDQRGAGVPWRLVAAAGGPVLAALLLASTVVLAKVVRRSRRRRGPSSDQVAGGWTELVDRARDLGATPPERATRRETAAALSEDRVGAMMTLAERADAGAFASHHPSDAQVAAYWADVDTAVRRLRQAAGWRRRWWAPLSLRSLRHRRRA